MLSNNNNSDLLKNLKSRLLYFTEIYIFRIFIPGSTYIKLHLKTSEKLNIDVLH